MENELAMRKNMYVLVEQDESDPHACQVAIMSHGQKKVAGEGLEIDEAMSKADMLREFLECPNDHVLITRNLIETYSNRSVYARNALKLLEGGGSKLKLDLKNRG